LFLNSLFDEPAATLRSDRRRTLASLTTQANEYCLECPLANQCLYQAVVRHDVAGFVAGTTPSQRQAIRARLRWTIGPESLDSFAGITTLRQIDHDEVVRMRRNCPSETLATIAVRMGCSLSTVKRHLRQARTETWNGSASPDRRPRLSVVPPSLDQVLDARRDVMAGQHRSGGLRCAA
jgi:hypothetical protein